ncbi:hypothetical protein HDU67_006801 [Dinochytrium kinnereticum]|nr:hypothetical protein HDU67_006801 [Dinochytrium kinnereticum]
MKDDIVTDVLSLTAVKEDDVDIISPHEASYFTTNKMIIQQQQEQQPLQHPSPALFPLLTTTFIIIPASPARMSPVPPSPAVRPSQQQQQPPPTLPAFSPSPNPQPPRASLTTTVTITTTASTSVSSTSITTSQLQPQQQPEQEAVAPSSSSNLSSSSSSTLIAILTPLSFLLLASVALTLFAFYRKRRQASGSSDQRQAKADLSLLSETNKQSEEGEAGERVEQSNESELNAVMNERSGHSLKRNPSPTPPTELLTSNPELKEFSSSSQTIEICDGDDSFQNNYTWIISTTTSGIPLPIAPERIDSKVEPIESSFSLLARNVSQRERRAVAAHGVGAGKYTNRRAGGGRPQRSCGDVMGWSCEQVSGWLMCAGVGNQFVEILRANNINGYFLLLLTPEKLTEMGIKLDPARDIIMNIVNDLKTRTVPRPEFIIASQGNVKLDASEMV